MPSYLCLKELDGHRVNGTCTRRAGHTGPHSTPIDWFEWEDTDYCRMPDCKFLSFAKRDGLCEDHFVAKTSTDL